MFWNSPEDSSAVSPSHFSPLSDSHVGGQGDDFSPTTSLQPTSSNKSPLETFTIDRRVQFDIGKSKNLYLSVLIVCYKKH